MQCDAKTIIESVSTAILVTDSQLKIAFANTAAEQLFSTSRSKLQGTKLLELLDHNEKNLIETLQNSNTPSFQGFTATDITFAPDPHLRFHADMYISLYTGRARGLVVEIHRLDYQQKLNDDLQRHHQNLAARDLIRNLAHEIKNPLGGIRGAAQLLEMIYSQDSELKDYTQVIIEQSDRLKHLVDRLLGPQRPNPQSMANIHYVIEKVLSLEHMATQGSLRFEKDYDPSLPELLLDVDAMQQALINIISNAVQALTESHTTYPTIKIRTRALMGALVNGIKSPMSIEIDIIDNGPGIPPKIKDMLFYPMVTTRAEGHGLGLSIAQNIVEHHHGAIECESKPGCTMFKIILPINGTGRKTRHHSTTAAAQANGQAMLKQALSVNAHSSLRVSGNDMLPTSSATSALEAGRAATASTNSTSASSTEEFVKTSSPVSGGQNRSRSHAVAKDTSSAPPADADTSAKPSVVKKTRRTTKKTAASVSNATTAVSSDESTAPVAKRAARTRKRTSTETK